MGRVSGIALFLLVQIAISCPAGATTYSGFCNGVTDSLMIYVVPRVNRPAYNTPVKDSIFKTMITRVAHDTGQAISGISSSNWGGVSRHHSNKSQPWNSNSTKILLKNTETYGGVPSRVFLDGSTYAVTGTAVCASPPSPDEKDSRWHPSTLYPNQRIAVTYHSADTVYLNGLISYKDSLHWMDISSVTNCTRQRGWRLPIRPHLIGQGEGNASFDGRWIVISTNHKRYNTNRPDSMVIVDMNPPQTDSLYTNGIRRVGPAYAIPPCSLSTGDCRIGNISISASGRYINVKYAGNDDAHRIFRVDTTTLVPSIVNMATSSDRCDGDLEDRVNGFILPMKHADMTLDPFDSNADVIVGVNQCSPGGASPSVLGRIAKVRLSDGVVTYLSKGSTGGFSAEVSAVHVSTRNQDRLGWAYASYDGVDNADTTTKRYSSEVVAYKLDGSKHMQRFAHMHEFHDSGYDDDDEAQPVPSRDGTRMMFASNWYHRPLSAPPKTQIKGYVVDARTTTPDVVSNLSNTTGTTQTTIPLTWTAPSEGRGFAVSSYDLRQSTSPINSGNFASATPVTTSAPKYPGATENVTAGGSCGTIYYFAMKSSNACETSGISNLHCAPTLGCGGAHPECEGARRIDRDQPLVFEFPEISPTPSFGQVTIRFTLPTRALGAISVVDIAGRLVARHDLSAYGPGRHEFPLAMDRQLRPGVYFVRLQHGETIVQRTAVLLK